MDRLYNVAAHALDWMSCTSKRGRVIARALLIERARTKRLRAELEEAIGGPFEMTPADLQAENERLRAELDSMRSALSAMEEF